MSFGFALAVPVAVSARATRPRRGPLGPVIALLLLLLPALLLWAWDRDRMLAAAARHGPRAVESVRALQRELAAVQGADDLQRLARLNRFFNSQIAYAEDLDARGEVDHWASPVESLARGLGDCEDYASAKYFGAIAAGVAPAKLRLVYVRAAMGGGARAHMVLAYTEKPGAQPLILDNLDGEIRPATERPDLTPVFSFNAEGLWQGTSGPAAGDAVSRLSRWRDLLAKARAEGLF
ncbi:MAG TPA: transglutaminase-like cysteine peptidase [Methylibium sp.]|uniref:transglutaminase-like cysteine peptidase n=1 Tax=Methylibium sp. TaxID=2067992 RepID=UPI002DB8CBE8|nr:transglutaminase-like cysteine peptidase [Methylibium sp.]HEU4460104.1 transglutaminase-like cysteine peptidase [Methylibium sp.]